MGLPGGSNGKESACSAGDLCLIPGSGRSPGEENDYPFWYSCLENSMDRGAWWAYSSMDPKGWDMPEPLSLFILLAVSSQGLPSVHAW